MDSRIQAIADRARKEFGLEHYTLGSHSFFTQGAGTGYTLSMEWFPNAHQEPIDEDLNPDGTASIEYDIQQDKFKSAVFVMGKTYSTAHPFKEKTIEEAAAWLEKMTGLTYERDFFAEQAGKGSFRFASRVAGVRLSPGLQLEVETDEEGRLLVFSTYGEAPDLALVEQRDFNLTLEEIEPIVKEQLTQINWPSEADERFVPVYAIDEAYVTVDENRRIPFLLDNRIMVELNIPMEWEEPLPGKIERNFIEIPGDVSADIAFDAEVAHGGKLSDEEIETCVKLTHDALRMEYSGDSGKWTLKELRPAYDHIEAFCYAEHPYGSIFKLKLALIIDRETMTVKNLIDNEAMFDMFDSYTPAPEPLVDHDTAFEKMVPSITLDPVYVFDHESNKYVLCGLIDSDQAVDAVTGEVLELRDI